MNVQHAKDNVDLDYFKCNAIEILDISLLSVKTDLHTAHKSQLCFTANNVYNINHRYTIFLVFCVLYVNQSLVFTDCLTVEMYQLTLSFISFITFEIVWIYLIFCVLYVNHLY
jgi:hypothetical protein